VLSNKKSEDFQGNETKPSFSGWQQHAIVTTSCSLLWVSLKLTCVWVRPGITMYCFDFPCDLFRVKEQWPMTNNANINRSRFYIIFEFLQTFFILFYAKSFSSQGFSPREFYFYKINFSINILKQGFINFFVESCCCSVGI